MKNIMGLMKQAEQMQQKMAEMQARLDAAEVEGVSGAGLVRLTLSGKGALNRVKIDPKIADPAETEMLEDLLLAAHADAWLGLGADGLSDVMGRIVDSIPEIGRLFETNLLSAESAAAILDEARELLMIRNLQSFEEVSALRATTEDLKARTIALQDQHRRDGLTGVFNRRHLDAVLEQESTREHF